MKYMMLKRRLLRVIVMLICVVTGFPGWAEWQMNTDFPLIGDPNAVKGGEFHYAITSYPATFRVYGPGTTTYLHSMMTSLVYQTLLDLHPTTLDYIPVLADAWEIKEDKKTFFFRLDPNAHWADGTPVTPEDVVFSWEFVTDPETQEPYSGELFRSRFDKPEIVDERTVKVVAKDAHWNNFLYFAGSLTILPAHTYQGKNYLENLNWELPNGSGPYQLGKYDKGNNITFERRDDFWAKENCANQGVHNFDRITFVVVRDENLTFEKFKKGELDFYNVLVSREWVQETDFDKVQKGWIQKRKIYTLNPNGVSGLAVNMRRTPLNDVRVRKALAHLYNRELFMEKLFFNEYEYIDSYYPGSMYANPQNEHIEYSPEKASQLLAESGWAERNKQGLLVKDGKTFSLTVLYSQKTLERHLTIFQEDLKRAGIELNLKQLDWTAMFQLVDERNFGLVSVAWTGLLFPNPESAYHSSLADQENTNNIVGIKHARIDEILDEYPTMFELDDRIAAVKEIDGLLYQEHPYILGWYGPFERILYWNKFGMPDYYLGKFADHRSMLSLWWYDNAKDNALQGAIKSNTPLEIGETVVDYWGVRK